MISNILYIRSREEDELEVWNSLLYRTEVLKKSYNENAIYGVWSYLYILLCGYNLQRCEENKLLKQS